MKGRRIILLSAVVFLTVCPFSGAVCGNVSEPEGTDGLVFSHTRQVNKELLVRSSAFYHRNEVIPWGGRSRGGIDTAKSVGLELEAVHQQDDVSLGINHAYGKELYWDSTAEVGDSGMVCFHDDRFTRDSVVASNVNELYHRSVHATTLFANVDFFNGRFILHGDVETLWGRDRLVSAGSSASIADLQGGTDPYEMEITANLSLTCHLNEHADLTAFVQNIPVVGDNSRYPYFSGSHENDSDKVNWIEQPTVFGLSGRIKIK
jgi:hypothetical protein